MAHDRFDFRVAGGHELGDIPFAASFAVIGENGAEGVAASEAFPGVLQLVETGHGRLRFFCGQQNARRGPGV